MTLTEERKKLIRIKDKGIEIIDEDLMNKIKNGNLSASMASSFLACPADWLLDKYILKELEHSEPIHLNRGTLFHSIMEAFFAVPNEYRTPQVLGTITQEVTNHDFPEFMSDSATKEWVKNAVMGYLSMGFDFQDEIIPTVHVDNKEQYGLEIFVKDTIGECTRPTVGFVDKLVEYEKDGKMILAVQDWKTGKKIHPYNPNKPIGPNNDFGYWRQQTLYAMLLENEGIFPDEAQLIFPVARGIVDVDFKSEVIRKQVIDDMEKVDRLLTRCIDENMFPFTPAQWCKWCHLLYKGKKKGRAMFPDINQNELNLIVEYDD